MQRKKQLNTRKTARFTNAGINVTHVKYITRTIMWCVTFVAPSISVCQSSIHDITSLKL